MAHGHSEGSYERVCAIVLHRAQLKHRCKCFKILQFLDLSLSFLAESEVRVLGPDAIGDLEHLEVSCRAPESVRRFGIRFHENFMVEFCKKIKE